MDCARWRVDIIWLAVTRVDEDGTPRGQRASVTGVRGRSVTVVVVGGGGGGDGWGGGSWLAASAAAAGLYPMAGGRGMDGRNRGRSGRTTHGPARQRHNGGHRASRPRRGAVCLGPSYAGRPPPPRSSAAARFSMTPEKIRFIMSTTPSLSRPEPACTWSNPLGILPLCCHIVVIQPHRGVPVCLCHPDRWYWFQELVNQLPSYGWRNLADHTWAA